MNRSPIIVDNVFGLEEYAHIYREVVRIRALNQFVTRPDAEDEGIDNHPLWTESFPAAIQEKMIDELIVNKIEQLFGFITKSNR
jgi:hypothetical protein